MLRATHPSGVPLHAALRENAVSGRLADGSKVRVVDIEEGSNWIEIEVGPIGVGQRSWIVRRYVLQARAATKTTPGDATPTRRSSLPDLPNDAPARSLDACLARLSEKPTASGGPRVMSFNVKWFPDGVPGKQAKGDGTNLKWLACTIAVSGAEAVAFQEFKTLERASKATDVVLKHLDRMTGGSWKAGFDDCPSGATQHVGIAWDSARVRMLSTRTIAELNPHGEACKNSLRPGFAAALRLSDGTELELISVHSKSGTNRRSIDLRHRTLDALSTLMKRASRPLLLAGDFNTMGCPKCSPAVPSADDRGELRRRAAAAEMALLDLEPACTHYYRGEPGLLDGFVLDTRLAKRARASSQGTCGALACSPGRADQLPFAEQVSDHCPILVELLP